VQDARNTPNIAHDYGDGAKYIQQAPNNKRVQHLKQFFLKNKKKISRFLCSDERSSITHHSGLQMLRNDGENCITRESQHNVTKMVN